MTAQARIFNKGAPPITPEQFIALLDTILSVGLGDYRTSKGRAIYSLSVNDIYEAEDILMARCGTVYANAG